MCGVAFSGKSTLAKEIAKHKKAALVSQDRIWFAKKEEWNLDPDSDEDWERIQKLSKAEIMRILRSGASVVYDDISLKFSDRESLRSLASKHGVEAALVYLDTPRSVQQERQAKNLVTKERHDVPQSIIIWGLVELEVPKEDEKPFIYKPKANIKNWLSNLP